MYLDLKKKKCYISNDFQCLFVKRNKEKQEKTFKPKKHVKTWFYEAMQKK